VFVQRNIVTRSHNRCRHGNATVCSVFIVEPLMSLSTILTVLAWQYNTALCIVLSYVRRCQLHNHTLVFSKGPDIFLADFNQIRGFST
jgi:hypothetical protein